MIEVYPDLESLSRAAAVLLVEQANLAVAARGRFSVALSGGNTPRRTYELLAAPPLKDQAPWDRVHVFWGDERCVPLNDSRSNARLAKEAWLDRVPIPGHQIHPMNCALDPAASEVPNSTCTNTLDDDCDSLTDCADGNCATDPACMCKPAGATCTTNGECCSNSCRRGKRR